MLVLYHSWSICHVHWVIGFESGLRNIDFSWRYQVEKLAQYRWDIRYLYSFVLIPTIFLIVTTTVKKSNAPRQNHQITASPRSTGTNFITSENFNFHWARHSIKSLTHYYLQALSWRFFDFPAYLGKYTANVCRDLQGLCRGFLQYLQGKSCNIY